MKSIFVKPLQPWSALSFAYKRGTFTTSELSFKLYDMCIPVCIWKGVYVQLTGEDLVGSSPLAYIEDFVPTNGDASSANFDMAVNIDLQEAFGMTEISWNRLSFGTRDGFNFGALHYYLRDISLRSADCLSTPAVGALMTNTPTSALSTTSPTVLMSGITIYESMLVSPWQHW